MRVLALEIKQKMCPDKICIHEPASQYSGLLIRDDKYTDGSLGSDACHHYWSSDITGVSQNDHESHIRLRLLAVLWMATFNMMSFSI